jgi:hypothetical protein
MATKFDLEVTISGLCLLRPKDTKDGMHVLLADHSTEHCPLVFYDSSSPPVKLKGMKLDLTACKGKQTTVPDIDADKAIPQVHTILADSGTKPKPLPDPDKVKIPHLAARVILPPGDKLDFPDEPRGPWNAEVKNVPTTRDLWLSWYVVWQVTGIEIDGDELPWKAEHLNGSAALDLPHVRPTGGWIRLVLSNLPPVGKPDCSTPDASDNPGKRPPAGKEPDKGTMMHHFRGLYGLYNLDAHSTKLPDLVYRGGEESAALGTAYNCVTSGGH